MNNVETATEAPVTAEQVWERIQAAAEAGEKELYFEGETIDHIDLTDRTIPISLDFRHSRILGDVMLTRSTFEGTYIEFGDAHIHGTLCLNGLKSTRGGYSLYLRKTFVDGEVMAKYTKLNWLCIGGLIFGTRGVHKQVQLRDTCFTRGVSIEPES